MDKKVTARPNCDICNCELTQENVGTLNPYHFSVTCEEHKEYGFVFNIDMIKLKLGYITELPWWYKKCTICQADLTDEEFNSIEQNDFQITCSKHREVRYNFQRDLSILWFEFKKEYPNAINNNEADWKLFHEWNKTRL